MKSEIIKNPSNVFQPISIMFTIESQKELDALKITRQALVCDEIDSIYPEETRKIWVSALDSLTEKL